MLDYVDFVVHDLIRGDTTFRTVHLDEPRAHTPAASSIHSDSNKKQKEKKEKKSKNLTGIIQAFQKDFPKELYC